jgi:hypothetical protein
MGTKFLSFEHLAPVICYRSRHTTVVYPPPQRRWQMFKENEIYMTPSPPEVSSPFFSSFFSPVVIVWNETPWPPTNAIRLLLMLSISYSFIHKVRFLIPSTRHGIYTLILASLFTWWAKTSHLHHSVYSHHFFYSNPLHRVFFLYNFFILHNQLRQKYKYVLD